MKPEQLKANTQDRVATWDEIRRATAMTPDRMLEISQLPGSYCEVDSDLGGVIRYPAEEFEFFAYLSEMEDPAAN